MKGLLALCFALTACLSSIAQSVQIVKIEGECLMTDYTFEANHSGFTPASFSWQINGEPDTTQLEYPNILTIPVGIHHEGMIVSCSITSSTGVVYTGSYLLHYEREITPLTASIVIVPYRLPATYCYDEVKFKAIVDPQVPVSTEWYLNDNFESYDSIFSPNNIYYADVVKVMVRTLESCVMPSFAEYTLDLGNQTNYVIDQWVDNFTVTENQGITARCSGAGTTQFTSDATNFKTQNWTLTPSTSGTIVSSGIGDYLATVTWNPDYSGTAKISATAIGCVNQTTSNKTFTVNTLPVTPVNTTLQQCNFESVTLTKEMISNSIGVASCLWYDIDGNLLSSGNNFERPALKDGAYTYKVKFVNDNGCTSLLTGNIELSVGNYPECDLKLNTIEVTSYGGEVQTESGYYEKVVGHSKSYYDLSGKLLQVQSLNLSTNEVLASQAITDEFERPVISTLVAPVNQSNFGYKHYFVTNQDGDRFSYQDFGEPFENTVPGTVGWYYSANNTKEVHVPISGHPYSRSDFYTDGTGEARRSTQPGEVHRMGMGHESLSGTFPVYSELDHYLTKRAAILPGITQPTTLKNAGVLTVVRDENHRYAVSFTDKSAKALMSALPGSESDHVFSISNSIKSSGNITPPSGYDYRILTYFCILTEQPVSLTGTGNYIVEDLIHDQPFTPPSTGQNWPIGFYRIVLGDASSSIQLTYQSYFKDVSYQFYDDAGRLITSVSPNGVIEWEAGTPIASVDHTSYKYNFRGWLMEMSETDAGITKYQYRKDGKIRFSQNALQRENETNGNSKGKFSYTHYDYLGRPVESGEYIGDETFTAQASKLDYNNQVVYNITSCKDWVKTYYDNIDENFTLAGLYNQDYVRGAVSYTENANIKTWYSYDEFGRVTWMAQKPKALPRFFVVKYTYDFTGNVLTVANLSYSADGNNNLLSEFYHHYEYDADLRLYKAYTSMLAQGEKKLRATYFYYLHGPLKRIELGDQLQGIDFVYNINGWLTQINHPDPAQDPGGDSNDVFGMVLDYYQSDLTNLFSVDVGKQHDPSLLHGLPSEMQTMYAQNDAPLIRFIPANDDFNSNYFKELSASNAVYKHLIFHSLQKTN